MRATKTTAQAIVNLRNNKDFAVFLGALGEYSSVLMEQLVYAKENNIHTVQGRTQCIAEILKVINNAPKVLESFNRPSDDAQY